MLTYWFKVKDAGRPKFKAYKKTLPMLDYTTAGFSIRGSWLRLPAGVSIPALWSRGLPAEPGTPAPIRTAAGTGMPGSWPVATPRLPGRLMAGSASNGGRTTATTTDPAHDLPCPASDTGGVVQPSSGEPNTRCPAATPGARPRPAGTSGPRGLRRSCTTGPRTRTSTRGRIWAKTVVDNHQIIAIQDFKAKFLARSTTAPKSADGAICAANTELIERGTRAGRTVVLAAPAYTTMTCSRCHQRQARLGLPEQTFRCADCGSTPAPDLNAATVIPATAERIRAGVNDIGHLSHPQGRAWCCPSQKPPALAMGNR